MAALGMGILLSLLIKETWQWVLVLLGFMLVGYLGLNMMGSAMFAIIIAVVYYISQSNKEVAVNDEEN